MDVLGVGGTATVFRGQLTVGPRRGENAAIKILHHHLTDNAELMRSFKNEAELLRKLDIDGIPAFFEFGAIEDIPYLVTELLVGVTLERLFQHVHPDDTSPPVSELIFVLSEVAKTLGAAHDASDEDGRELQLVHRDVSPHNIFITREGRVVLLDFGIARAADITRVTQTGTIKGKLAYMAPEQLKGSGIDARSDVFALGVVLWECLTGRRLFERANQLETAMAIDEAEIPEVDTVNPTIPQGLAALVRLALVRERSRRFSSAAALGIALEGTLPADRDECRRRVGAMVKGCLLADQLSFEMDAETDLDLASAPTLIERSY
jgi:serine/threonine-protein kinase